MQGGAGGEEEEPPLHEPITAAAAADEEEEEEEEEFEFSFLSDEAEIVAADEIFRDGKIRAECFPLFDRDLFRLYQAESGGRGGGGGGIAAAAAAEAEVEEVVGVPLRRLMIEERDTGASWSSAEDNDDLRGIPVESYCLWTPGMAPASPGMRRKSKSTGSDSRRWKLRDLVVGRSRSDGKHKLALLVPPRQGKTSPETRKKEASLAAVHRAYYNNRNGVGSKDHRHQSFLPYRKELVGLFGAGAGAGSSRRS